GAEPRIASVAADMVAHFEERGQAQTGKAMVVGMSRDICVHLYNEIIELRPDWHDADPERGAIKIVMTGSASDQALLRPHIYSAQVTKRPLTQCARGPGRGGTTVDAHHAYSPLGEKLDGLRGMLNGSNGHGFDYSGFLTGGHKTLAGAANYVLGIKDGKKRFADAALAMSKAFTLCCTLDEAKAVREEVAFFQAVKVILTKREISQQKRTDEAREL